MYETGNQIEGQSRHTHISKKKVSYLITCLGNSYVEQNDIHMPLITVKESIEFSSALRLPKGTRAARRRQFMQQVKTQFT
jgi:ABC-type multidrug transport system ATPase subunit